MSQPPALHLNNPLLGPSPVAAFTVALPSIVPPVATHSSNHDSAPTITQPVINHVMATTSQNLQDTDDTDTDVLDSDTETIRGASPETSDPMDIDTASSLDESDDTDFEELEELAELKAKVRDTIKLANRMIRRRAYNAKGLLKVMNKTARAVGGPINNIDGDVEVDIDENDDASTEGDEFEGE